MSDWVFVLLLIAVPTTVGTGLALLRPQLSYDLSARYFSHLGITEGWFKRHPTIIPVLNAAGLIFGIILTAVCLYQILS